MIKNYILNHINVCFMKCSQRLFSILLIILVFFTTESPFVTEIHGQTGFLSDVKFSGDFRLRYENTSNEEPGSTLLEGRNREVVRFRAGITKQINELINFGARLTTGSSNDPNTADVTLGNFVNDLEVSLDRLYLQLKSQDFSLHGGKFANPFMRTDLVWDGDVNPQGVAGSYTFSGSKQIIPKITGIFYIIDEHSGSIIPDSDMLGGQLEFATHPSENFSFTLAGSYYDYDITSLSKSNADAGDTRSNNVILDSLGSAMSYLSDFDLLDVIAVVEYRGFDKRYPIRFVGDYVKNLGAETDQDQGFMFDLFIGRSSKKNDLRFRYGYSETETDAVLAAFSNDNTTIATNYLQHTITVDYVVLDNTKLNLTWYIYKNKMVTSSGRDEFISRLRLNAVLKF